MVIKPIKFIQIKFTYIARDTLVINTRRPFIVYFQDFKLARIDKYNKRQTPII